MLAYRLPFKRKEAGFKSSYLRKNTPTAGGNTTNTSASMVHLKRNSRKRRIKRSVLRRITKGGKGYQIILNYWVPSRQLQQVQLTGSIQWESHLATTTTGGMSVKHSPSSRWFGCREYLVNGYYVTFLSVKFHYYG